MGRRGCRGGRAGAALGRSRALQVSVRAAGVYAHMCAGDLDGVEADGAGAARPRARRPRPRRRRGARPAGCAWALTSRAMALRERGGVGRGRGALLDQALAEAVAREDLEMRPGRWPQNPRSSPTSATSRARWPWPCATASSPTGWATSSRGRSRSPPWPTCGPRSASSTPRSPTSNRPMASTARRWGSAARPSLARDDRRPRPVGARQFGAARDTAEWAVATSRRREMRVSSGRPARAGDGPRRRGERRRPRGARRSRGAGAPARPRTDAAPDRSDPRRLGHRLAAAAL